MIERIGFMQGRLSPLVRGKIQAFPVDHWREEMFLASRNNLACMEWTLDYEELHLNPIMTNSGQFSISQLQKQTDLNIISLTGDLFMQEPFWQNVGKKKENNWKNDVVQAEKKEGCVYLTKFAAYQKTEW